MSWKSIGLSILSLVITIGLLFGTTFLFMIHYVLGIIGIILLIVVPLGIRHKALGEASGIIDKVIAKYIMPVATVIIAAIAVMMIIGWIPNPFQ